jgi:hypothetical protein
MATWIEVASRQYALGMEHSKDRKFYRVGEAEGIEDGGRILAEEWCKRAFAGIPACGGGLSIGFGVGGVETAARASGTRSRPSPACADVLRRPAGDTTKR